MPNEDIIYIGDTKRFPYGTKSREIIIELSEKITNHLLEQDVKAIVIACGTATSQSLEYLQDKFSIPIIGVISPTVEYIARNKNIKKNMQQRFFS